MPGATATDVCVCVCVCVFVQLWRSSQPSVTRQVTCHLLVSHTCDGRTGHVTCPRHLALTTGAGRGGLGRSERGGEGRGAGAHESEVENKWCYVVGIDWEGSCCLFIRVHPNVCNILVVCPSLCVHPGCFVLEALLFWSSILIFIFL